MKFVFLFISILLFSAFAEGREAVKQSQLITLGDTKITVNIYEKKGVDITFFAPHFNEELGRRLAKEAVALKGGRFVEIESLDETGNPLRNLNFQFGGKNYSVDPNRIYTANGRRCGISSEIEAPVKAFTDELLKIILAADGKSLRRGESFLVAVHNNRDVDERVGEQKNGDLTAHAFAANINLQNYARGAFAVQAAGIFLSNNEFDADNFVLLSTARHLGFFAENNFNVVVQKTAQQLQTPDCALDDGSLSVFAGQNDIAYVNLEADAKNGAARQKQMLEAVYQLAARNEKGVSKL